MLEIEIEIGSTLFFFLFRSKGSNRTDSSVVSKIRKIFLSLVPPSSSISSFASKPWNRFKSAGKRNSLSAPQEATCRVYKKSSPYEASSSLRRAEIVSQSSKLAEPVGLSSRSNETSIRVWFFRFCTWSEKSARGGSRILFKASRMFSSVNTKPTSLFVQAKAIDGSEETLVPKLLWATTSRLENRVVL